MARPKSPPMIIITRAVYELDLTPNEKFVLANIGNVITSGGIYQFDNEWITTFTKVSKRQVSTIIRTLAGGGFIEVELIYREGTKEVLKRVVKLTSRGMEVCNPTSRSTLPGGIEVDFLDNRKSLLNSKDNKKSNINIAFAEFWDLYNKKRGDVGKIEKKWNALSDKDRQLAMDYIPRYVKSEPNKRYRKDPTTFLNNKSWNDEILEPLKPKSETNGVDVFTPILREIRRVGGYGTPEFKEWEKDAQQMVKQLGWGNCCTMTEFDLRQSVNNNISLTQ